MRTAQGERPTTYDWRPNDMFLKQIWLSIRAVATLLKWCDEWIIDGLLVNGPAFLARVISYPARLFEWGLLQWYGLVMTAGLVGFGLYLVYK